MFLNVPPVSSKVVIAICLSSMVLVLVSYLNHPVLVLLTFLVTCVLALAELFILQSGLLYMYVCLSITPSNVDNRQDDRLYDLEVKSVTLSNVGK